MSVRYQFRETLLLDAANNSEKLIATLRILMYFFIGLIPFGLYFIYQDSRPEVFISVVLTTIGLVIAIIIYVLVRLKFKSPSLIWFITATDISFVTLVLLMLALYGNPLVASNSLIVWQGYGLLIFASSIRLNYRITFFAGMLSIVQYGLLMLYADARWDLSVSNIFSDDYGSFTWSVQLGRLFVLMLITILATGFVIRSHRLVVFSGTDSLTGLKNRAYFEHIFNNEVNHAITQNEPLSIVFLDMDHFKHINDQYGHAIGDLALQRVADVLKSFANKSNKVARWGGEEFVFLFPNTAKIEAIKLINQVREELKSGIQIGEDLNLSLQLSAGLSECPAESHDSLELINLADDRMLQAKHAGRDRVVAG